MTTNNKVTFACMREFAAFCTALTRERIAFHACQNNPEGNDEAYIVTITGESEEEGEE